MCIRRTEVALTGAADLNVPLTVSMASGAELGGGEGLSSAGQPTRPTGASPSWGVDADLGLR